MKHEKNIRKENDRRRFERNRTKTIECKTPDVFLDGSHRFASQRPCCSANAASCRRKPALPRTPPRRWWSIAAASQTWVERFGRRGTEPNELLRSEFGENSCTIQEFSLENSENFNIFENIGEIPTKFHQNLSRNHQQEFKNDDFLQNLPKNAKKFDEKFLKY